MRIGFPIYQCSSVHLIRMPTVTMRTMERLQSFLCWFTRFLFVTDNPATNLIFWWFGNFFCFNDDDFTLCGRGLVFGVQAGPGWNRHSIINSPDSSDGNNNPDLIMFEVLTIPQVLHGQVNLGVEENEANHRNKAWAKHKLNKLISRFSPVVNPQTHVW